MKHKPALLLLLLWLTVIGCGGDRGPNGGAAGGRPPAPSTVEAGADAPADRTGSAEAPGNVSDPALRVDADSAWIALVRQVRFGPRVPGTPEHRACGDWLAASLQSRGARVEEDHFTYRDPRGRTWPLRNILGRMGPEGDDRLLLVAHWDTRPWADRDPDSTQHATPIPGASDGASGVAVLLEVARVLEGRVLPVGVDILFTDGEDLGRDDDREGYCRGSKRFAEGSLGRYRRAIVVDLVGDRDLHLPVEQHSLARAPEVVDWVWERGMRLSPGVFERRIGPVMYDDHVPLLDAGLPAVDLIDIVYPAWHTLADDLPAVSAQSLVAVARVVADLAAAP